MSNYKFHNKYNCVRQESACTYYEDYIPEDSKLVDDDCHTIEETTKDLYEITDKIKKDNDFSELGEDCLEYNEEKPGEPTVKEIAKVFEKEICELKKKESEKAESICQLSILECGLDLKELKDSCNVIPTIYSDLLQTLIDEISLLKEKVATLENNV